MSWAFFGLFAGFGAAQALQSSLNATLGFINLACLYFAFVIVGLICPPIVNSGVVRLGWRPILMVSGGMYVLMILSNLDTAASSWVVQPIANVFLGAGAALLWTTQNVYFGQCARLAGKAQASGAASETEAVAAMTTRFNTSFFSVFQFSNSFGCLVSSCLILAFGHIDWARMLLFFVLAGAAVCGIFAFLFLPNIECSSDEQQAPPSVTSALQAIADTRFVIMLPWIVTNGMTFAFVNADFTSDIVSPLLGPGYVGFLMTGFYASDAFFCVFWGQLISKQFLSRRTAFIGSASFWLLFLLLKVFWTREPNFDSDNDWKAIPGTRVEALDVVLPLVLALVAGAGDGFWTPGPPSVLQSFFAETNLLGSMAAYKAVQSLGFAVQFTLGATLKPFPDLRNFILLCCLATSLVSVLFLDSCKQRLDPQKTSSMLSEALDCQS